MIRGLPNHWAVMSNGWVVHCQIAGGAHVTARLSFSRHRSEAVSDVPHDDRSCGREGLLTQRAELAGFSHAAHAGLIGCCPA